MYCLNLQVMHGIPDNLQDSAFQLYLNELKRHTSTLAISDEQLIKLLVLSLDWRFALAAVKDNHVVGLAGYQCKAGSFTGGASPVQLLRCLGIRTFFRLNRSHLAASRKAQPKELLHDGLIVSVDYRRQGVAMRLLNALRIHAEQANFTQMRLDVTEHNLPAIALYQKMGYQADHQKANGHWVYRRHLNSAVHWSEMSSEQ
ncbi:GNAT family N-acetyltransferase [Marinomonas transparens]|uniref:GNAT family N-acetyltransferase n=1 Tax=Marinomonas transparens TaxID=2795388 RepID=A0A934MYN7_9GAMM|nr:GNAT family N-acetyltransferase [Marinomonas transparens]MBJ7536650.1 GNAT family N-acetyltransferase [Marinomonas transparens]